MPKIETVKVLSPAEAAFKALNAKAKPGPKGERGEQGDRGERGERGLAGMPGTDGIGLPGPQGETGKSGETGDQGARGVLGSDGERGEKGDLGETPAHRWRSTALTFKNPDGTWGKERELKGMPGTGGGGAAGGSIIRDVGQLSDKQGLLGGFEFIPVTTSTFAINSDTNKSYRIFHVTFQGDVTITVPLDYPEASVIAINNETGGNTVTITGEI